MSDQITQAEMKKIFDHFIMFATGTENMEDARQKLREAMLKPNIFDLMKNDLGKARKMEKNP